MNEISFLAQIIPDKPQLFSANADASLTRMIPALIEALENEKKDINKENYKVLIAYQLTDSDAILNSLFQDLSISKIPLSEMEWEITNPELLIENLELQPVKNKNSTPTFRMLAPDLSIKDLKLKLKSSLTSFQELQMKNGYYVILTKSVKSVLRLKVTLPNNNQRLFEPGAEVLIGRTDIEKGIKPDFDLTPYLKNPLHISRQQAIFFEEEERWKIKLHPDSSSLVYIDNQKMEKKKNYEIRDETEIKFGNDVNNPDLRIIVASVA